MLSPNSHCLSPCSPIDICSLSIEMWASHRHHNLALLTSSNPCHTYIRLYSEILWRPRCCRPPSHRQHRCCHRRPPQLLFGTIHRLLMHCQ